MREYWQGLLMGVLVGTAASYFYKNNKQEIKKATRQVKARSKKTLDMFKDMENKFNNLTEQQES